MVRVCGDAPLPARVQLLAQLRTAELAAAAGRVRDAEAALPAAAALLAGLEQAQASDAGGTPDGPSPEAAAPAAARGAELRLRYRVLRAQLLLAAGRTGELQATGAGRRPAPPRSREACFAPGPPVDCPPVVRAPFVQLRVAAGVRSAGCAARQCSPGRRCAVGRGQHGRHGPPPRPTPCGRPAAAQPHEWYDASPLQRCCAGKGGSTLLEVEQLDAAGSAAAGAPPWLRAAGCLAAGGRAAEAAAQLAHGRQLLGGGLAALGVDVEVRMCPIPTPIPYPTQIVQTRSQAPRLQGRGCCWHMNAHFA